MHAGYHKIASVWFENVLSDVAGRYGLTFSSTYLPFIKRDPVFRLRQPAPEVGPPTWIGDVNLFMHSRNFSDELFAGRPIRGTHIVRDPRDVAVSGYRYHLWTDEEWVHTPYDGFGGRSYQETLRSLPESEGLLLEVGRTCRWTVAEMRAWDYTRSDFLELRYEDLIEDEDSGFERIFRHYGFTDAAVETSVEIARKHSFKAMTGRAIGEEGGQQPPPLWEAGRVASPVRRGARRALQADGQRRARHAWIRARRFLDRISGLCRGDRCPTH